jgi:hypothetical protein
VTNPTLRALAHVACIAALFATAAPASAQRTRDPRLDLAAEADLHFELGVELQQRGDCRGAL